LYLNTLEGSARLTNLAQVDLEETASRLGCSYYAAKM